MAKEEIIDLSCKFRRAVIYAAPVKAGSKYWFFYIDAIYSYDETDGKVKKEQELNIQGEHKQSFCFMNHIEKKIILVPWEGRSIIIYDTEKQSRNIKVLDLGKEGTSLYYRYMIPFGKKAFMLPGSVDYDILVMDNLNSIRHIDIVHWEGKLRGSECTSEYAIQNNYLWITACYSKQVLKLNMTTEKYELIEIGEDSIGYTGIVFDGEYIWLAESSTGAFIRYKTENGDIKKFDAPAALDYNSAEKNYVHLSLFHFGKYIVSIPALCGKMTILDKETEIMDIVNIDFFDAIMETKANYKNGNYSSSSFGKKVDEKTLWVQRAVDGRIACIHMENLTYTTFSLEFDENEFHRLGAWGYRSGTTMLAENWMTSLESLIYFMEDAGASTVKKLDYGIGAEIWKKVK